MTTSGQTTKRTSASVLRLATRGSALALEQTAIVERLIRAHHPGLVTELVTVTTTGDANQSAPVTQLGDGAFVRGVEAALVEGRADVAVHSAKDVPTTEPPGLTLAAFPGRDDPRDVTIPWIAWGRGVKPGALPAADSVRTMDTASTALWLLGLSSPPDWSGQPIVQAFDAAPAEPVASSRDDR